MKRRRLWMVGAALLALDGCQVSTSTEGALSNGAFSYVCNSAPDNACDGAEGDLAAIPDRIAVGASFTLTYQEASGVTLAAQLPETTTPSILSGSAGSFEFVHAGSAGVIVPASGGVVDFAVLQGADIAGIGAFDRSENADCSQFFPDAPDGGVPDGGVDGGDAGTPNPGPGGVAGLSTVSITTGRSIDLSLEPIDSTGHKLAGPASMVVTSSDPGIVAIATPVFAGAHAFELCGLAAGAVTITVGMGETVVTFPAFVVPQ